MLKLSVILTVLSFCNGLAENSNGGECVKFQYDHDVVKKIVEIEHDHEVMKYLLSRYEQLEDTNLETAKILESQDASIRSLQTGMQQARQEAKDKFDELENAIATNAELIEKSNDTITHKAEELKNVKVDISAFSEKTKKLQERSKLNSNGLLELQNTTKMLSDDTKILREKSRNCSSEIKELHIELDSQGEQIEKLKSKYDNLTVANKHRDCGDILTADKFARSGVYTIYPTSNFKAFGLSVYCDMSTQGGGWIVFQRRQDGSEDFYRGWQDYKTGFGNLKSEFWLGLDNIHALVSDGKWELLINMRDDVKGEKYALYKTFSIGPESGGYVLTVGDYSGDAGDSLINSHNGMKFTTKDRDNDKYSKNCAAEYIGAWWHKACFQSNLNGVYGGTGWKSPVWDTLTGANPVEFVEMKIKRK